MTTITECFKLQALLRGVALLLRPLIFYQINPIALKAAGLMNQSQTTILFSLNWLPSGKLGIAIFATAPLGIFAWLSFPL